MASPYAESVEDPPTSEQVRCLHKRVMLLLWFMGFSIAVQAWATLSWQIFPSEERRLMQVMREENIRRIEQIEARQTAGMRWLILLQDRFDVELPAELKAIDPRAKPVPPRPRSK